MLTIGDGPRTARALTFAFLAILLTIGCSETTTESIGGSEGGGDDEDARAFDRDAVTIGGDEDAGSTSEGEPSADATRTDATDASGGSDAESDADSPITPGDDTTPPPPDVGEVGDCGLPTTESPWTPPSGDFVLRDEETGSLWNARGEAFDGPCAGSRLRQLPAFTAFWFSWSVSRHGADIWNVDEDNTPGPIEPDPSGRCNVPCDQIRSGGPPPDGIPALDHEGRWDRPQPVQMVDASEGDYLADDDLVLGVVIDGQARAYPHNILWWHEIQIDEIGGTEFNVTYCPLTGSGLVIPVDQGDGEPFYSYVSGRLYNANLTMFERNTEAPTFWNQMLLRGIQGPRMGERLRILPVTETTWERWREMYPDTLVTSDDTGYSRSYNRYPYGDYRTDDGDTFMRIQPGFDDTYEAKDMILSLEGEEATRGYAFPEMETFGDRVVINDRFEGDAVVIMYDAEHQMAVPFARESSSQTFTFEGATAP